MNIKQRLKNIEMRLKAQINSPNCQTDSRRLMQLPGKVILGALKILIEAEVISPGSHSGSPDQLASEIYQGTIKELNCLTNRSGQYDLAPLSDEQLARMENLYLEGGAKQ